MIEFSTVALTTILAAISPDMDLVIVTRNSLPHGQHAGVLCALGIALGIQVCVFYTMFGVGPLIVHTPTLPYGIRLVGAAYLMWTGQKILSAKPLPSGETAGNSVDTPTLLTFVTLRMGFLTNALSPKTTLSMVSTCTQVIHANMPLLAQFGHDPFMSAAHAMWFVLVVAASASGTLRRSLLTRQRIVDGVTGVVPIGLGLVLRLARLA